MDTEKFDGVERRPLKPEEIRQIAGRAGRYGMYAKGYVGATQNLELIRAGLEAVVPPLQYAVVGFSDLVLQVDFDLLEVLTQWNQMPTVEPYRKLDITRYIAIISKMREMGFLLSKEQELRAANIPFDETEEALRELFFQFLNRWQRGSPLSSRASRRGRSPCRSWSCTTGSWTSTSPSPRPSTALWTRTSSTTAGSGWPTRSTRSCSTGCAATSASAPAAGRPCPSTTGDGCATPVSCGREKIRRGGNLRAGFQLGEDFCETEWVWVLAGELEGAAARLE